MSDNPTLEHSIEGISFIEKAEHSINDLEESINQCVICLEEGGKTTKPKSTLKLKPKAEKAKPKHNGTITNQKTPIKNSKKNSTLHSSKSSVNISGQKKTSARGAKKSPAKKPKSILKTSKEKITEMKNKIAKIFEDNAAISANISEIQNKNEEEFSTVISNAQEKFEDKIGALYEEKFKKLADINKEYDFEIFKVKDYCLKEKGDHSKSVVDIIYKELLEDKKEAIKKCEKEFEEKKKEIFNEYKTAAEDFNEFSVDERSVIYKNELFETLKEKINEVVAPEKRVSIKLDEEKAKELQEQFKQAKIE